MIRLFISVVIGEMAQLYGCLHAIDGWLNYVVAYTQ